MMSTLPRRVRPRFAPGVESLEGRRVPSHVPGPRALVAATAVNPADGSGAGAIFGALNGGAGSEFATLIRRQVPNLGGSILQFASGRKTQMRIKGFAAKLPRFLPEYAGPMLDQFNATAAGAVVLRDGRLVLGAVMRGPIDLPVATRYVWGLGRGGPSLAPGGFGPEGVGYDAVVAVDRVGTAVSASVLDLRTGASTAIDPAAVKIEGPTIRVFLDAPSRLLPSTGAPLARYRFAFWARSGPEGTAAIGSAIPSSGTIPIGLLNPRAARR